MRRAGPLLGPRLGVCARGIRWRRPGRSLALAVVLLASLPATVRAHTFYLAPAGSDSGPGTAARPWRTLLHAEAKLAPGDVVYLRPGTYGARGTTTLLARSGARGRPVVFAGQPGQARPAVLGHVQIDGSHVRLEHLRFLGPTGPVKKPSAENPRGEDVQVAVGGDDVGIIDSEVSGNAWHAGIFLQDAERVLLLGNVIRDNGDRQDPSQANLCHGIYFRSGSGLIVDNVVEGNVARGIQLYDRPHDVVVARNTVVANGRAGIQFAAATASSTALGNLIALNGDVGIRTASLTGVGNVATGNVAFANRGGAFVAGDPGLTLVHNASALDAAKRGLASGRDVGAIRESPKMVTTGQQVAATIFAALARLLAWTE